MRQGMLCALAIAGFAFGPSPARAQGDGDSRNLITNGGFERGARRENLWDGVAANGFLTGNRHSQQALTERAQLGALPMPMSVNVVDINGNGLLDIVMADPTGYFYVYKNSGTRTEPKFTHGELIPIFLSSEENTRPFESVANARRVPRLCLVDWTRNGALDMFVGNFLGELFFIQNQGGGMNPDFRQPRTYAEALVPTADNGRLWANILAPAAADITRNGRPEILIGEGTYSANAVHMLIAGQGARPQFDNSSRNFLAYGDGREQLIPAPVDFNGNGYVDLIVADRTGFLNLYTNPGAGWKPGDEFAFSKTIPLGNQEKQPGLVSPYAADLNGDGLFDLIMGRTNGRIAVAYNVGTKEAPKFNAPEELRGTPRFTEPTNLPSGWSVELNEKNGNAYITMAIVNAESDSRANPPEGKNALRINYTQPPNDLFQFPSGGITGATRRVHLRFERSIPTQKDYAFSFQGMGQGVSNATFRVEIRGYRELDRTVERLDRGARVRTNTASQTFVTEGALNPGSTWTNTNRNVHSKFTDKDLQELKTARLRVSLSADIAWPSGVLYLDNFVLVER